VSVWATTIWTCYLTISTQVIFRNANELIYFYEALLPDAARKKRMNMNNNELLAKYHTCNVRDAAAHSSRGSTSNNDKIKQLHKIKSVGKSWVGGPGTIFTGGPL